MNFQKIFLYALLVLIIFFLWTDWIKEQSILPTTTEVSRTMNSSTSPPDVLQGAEKISKDIKAPLGNVPVTRLVHVRTDVLDLWIDKKGGNLVRADLLRYADSKQDRRAVRLLDDSVNQLYVTQTGLMGSTGPDSTEAQAMFEPTQTEYLLSEGQKKLVVDLSWRNAEGLRIIKSYVFEPGKYAFDVRYRIENHQAKPWEGNVYAEIIRKKIERSTLGLFNISAYEGAAISSPEKPYEKWSFKDLSKKPLNREISSGWLAMQQHYFLSAILPESNQPYHYYSDVSATEVFTVGAISGKLLVMPGTIKETFLKIYVGPELADQMNLVSPTLKLTIDYGWLWFISEAIFWFMKYVYDWIGNWGWAIIIVTVTIKILFYRLSASSYRSMANMKKLQPKLQLLKERYAEDRMRFNQAVMELYKKEKINPLGGCLPVLIQIPVFIALYWVLIESVQLRQAPFIGWIQDLSARDPYFVLPILMGLTMFVQQKLNPPPPDPVQAKVMMALPVVFTFLFLYFPAGLVLYWVVNNSLSILQQWYITKKSSDAGMVKKKKT